MSGECQGCGSHCLQCICDVRCVRCGCVPNKKKKKKKYSERCERWFNIQMFTFIPIASALFLLGTNEDVNFWLFQILWIPFWFLFSLIASKLRILWVNHQKRYDDDL